MISFDQEVCRNLKAALRREWLETNGLGSFASSTIVGLNTRRYHGLLIAVTTPPVGRLVLRSKVEETLIIDGQRFELSANRYPGIVHPQGYRYLTHFRLDPFPVLTYAVESMPIEKSICMIHGEHSTVIQYEFRVSDVACRGDSGKGASVTAFADGRVQLEVPPLIAFREYHRTTRENGTLNPHVEREKALATVAPYEGLPALHFAHDADEIDVAGHWYRHFEYEVERERGLDFVEDLFSPFAMRYDVSRRTLAVVERDLLTPSGLRSLAPGDPNYRGRYEGNP